MDPLDRAQTLLLCDLCQRAALQSHCELCQINLCKNCVGEHLSDSSKGHKVVPYKHRNSTLNYPECQKHSKKHCELYCEKCDIPVCSTCISSDKHQGHTFTDVQKKLQKIDLEKDLEELKKRIYPSYEEITSDLNSEKVKSEKHYEKLTTAVTKQGEDWHREINIIVGKRKSEIDKMKKKHLTFLNNQEKEIKQITSEVKQSILDLKKMLDSNDVSLTAAYKSRNGEFRSLLRKVNASLPSFSPQQINTEKLNQMFGSVSVLSITTEEHGCTMGTIKATSCSIVQPLLDEPSSDTKDFEQDVKEREKQIHPVNEIKTLDLNSEEVNSNTTAEHGCTMEAASCPPVQPLPDEPSSNTKDVEKNLKEVEKQIDPAFKVNTMDLKTEIVNSITREDNRYTIMKPETVSHSPVKTLLDESSSHMKDWGKNAEELEKPIDHEEVNCNTTVEHGYTMETTEAVSCPPVQLLLDEPSSNKKDLEKNLKEVEKQIDPAFKENTIDIKSKLVNSITTDDNRYTIRKPETVSCPPVQMLADEPSSHISDFGKNAVELEKPINHALEDLTIDLNSEIANSLRTEEHHDTKRTSEAVSYSQVQLLLDEPKLIGTIETRCHPLYSVTCRSDEEIWIRWEDKIMKLFNLQGKNIMSIQTKSGNNPSDITVTSSGDLVYTDNNARTVNIVKNKQIQEVIKLEGWKPRNVCSTFSGDLLVTMDYDDKQSKVVRYCDSTEKQTIQFDSEGKPLFSSGYHKNITENRNLDICVSDFKACDVVVVNQAGHLRFRYTGHSAEGNFRPYGITTDSHNQILTADCYNHCIHILDKDGQFLCYIDNCDLRYPFALCVDTSGNLFVAEYNNGKVKKIKYMSIS